MVALIQQFELVIGDWKEGKLVFIIGGGGCEEDGGNEVVTISLQERYDNKNNTMRRILIEGYGECRCDRDEEMIKCEEYSYVGYPEKRKT